MTQAFISLDASSGNCDTVPITITDSFLADGKGNWEGEHAFSYFEAPFQFTFSGFVVPSLSEYSDMMATYYKTLEFYGEISKKQNLGMNLIVWMSMVRYYSTDDPATTDFSKVGRGDLQYMQLTGDPSIIFQARYTGLALGSIHGYCSIPSMVMYDEANALFRATLNQALFQNSTVCSEVTSPFLFQKSRKSNIYFSIDLDVRSFAIALSVNLGYLKVPDLMPSSGSVISFIIGTVKYSVGKYFDIRYPLMNAIFCLYNETTIPSSMPQITQLCLVATGSGLFLPVFNHIGNSMDEPEYCDCTNPSGYSDQCNDFYLMAGLIAFDTTSDTSTFPSKDSLKRLIQLSYFLVDKFNGDYNQLNRDSFNASSTAVLISSGSSSPKLKRPSYIVDTYDFCSLPSQNTTCSLLVFYTLDQENMVSQYHYPLGKASCTDTLRVNVSAWSFLETHPPTPLTQIYYRCVSHQYDALLNAVGVASGNTSIAMLLLLLLSVPLVFSMMICFKVVPKEQEYSEKQKERTLDTLATLLLRAKDYHYEALEKNGTIVQIANELITAVNYSSYEMLRLKEEKPLSPDRLKKSRSYSCADFHELEENRDLLGKVVIYRITKDTKENPHSLFKRSLSESNLRSLTLDHHGGFELVNHSIKTAHMSSDLVHSHHHDIEARLGSSPSSSPPEKSRIRKFYFFSCLLFFLSFYLLISGMKILNLLEKELTSPADDPNWIVPYQNAAVENIVDGMVYYFSTAMRNQLVRENAGKEKRNASSTPLSQIDLDYARAVILTTKLLTVIAFAFFELYCYFLCRWM
jgi:hypothetical protein